MPGEQTTAAAAAAAAASFNFPPLFSLFSFGLTETEKDRQLARNLKKLTNYLCSLASANPIDK